MRRDNINGLATTIGYLIIFLLNATWGIIQTSLGLLLFIYFINRPHYLYKGSIVTTSARPRTFHFEGGISTELFIFVTHDIKKEQINDSNSIKHEYGHCLQSTLLGPLYLIIIGIPSLIWMIFFRNWRMQHNKKYMSWVYTEFWADRWGKVNRD